MRPMTAISRATPAPASRSPPREDRTRRVPAIIPVAKLRSLTVLSTAVILTGLVLAAILSLSSVDVNQAFAAPAPAVGIALAIGIGIEAAGGVRNLVRVDIFMLVVLYLLTFLEFLFPQDSLIERISLEGAQTAVMAVLLGYAGIVVGRHAFPPRRPLTSLSALSISARATMWLLVGCFFLGYLYMLLAVNFDLLELLYQMSRPRFSQPWSRGRYGSLSTLLNEFGLLTYLLPPLAASVLAQRKRFSRIQTLVALAILIFVFYEAFAGGTRNILLTHLATFTATYALLQPKLSVMKIVRIALPAVALGAFGVYYMAEIRTVGLTNFAIEESRTQAFFIDMNLVNIAILTEVLPYYAPHLGLEIPYVAVIRPIPRALWPSKPEGLSFSIEDAAGVGDSMTLTATFVGEFWMAGGYFAVGLGALLLGAGAAAWNRVGARATQSLDLILYSAGFFPAGLCMRSFLAIAPAMLPVLALWLAMRWRGSRVQTDSRRHAQMFAKTSPSRGQLPRPVEDPRHAHRLR